MKVGATTLMTLFLIALPLAAFAGNGCPDDDGDTICNDVDNCPNTPNVAQTDTDADGQGDLCDNCIYVQNGPLAGPYPGRDSAGAVTPGHQCDTNSDGYGNVCDGDMDDNGNISAADKSFYLGPWFADGPLLFPNPPFPGTAQQSGDMNCDNFVLGSDINFYWGPSFATGDPSHPPPVVGPFMFGRSGLSCVAAFGAATPPGSCPP